MMQIFTDYILDYIPICGYLYHQCPLCAIPFFYSGY